MSQQWYYSRGQGQEGPVDTDTLRRIIASGQVTLQDLVWCDGMPDWRPAGNIAAFAPAVEEPSHQYARQHPQQGAWPGQQAPYPAQLQYHTPSMAGGYAGFWLRFCAAFVDGLILAGINFVLGFTAGFAAATSGGRADPSINLLVQVVGLVVGWLYFALQESSSAQATLGKRALNIYVTDGQGQPLSFGRATGRHFGKLVSMATCTIGYIMAGFTQRKQALHDMMADCLVLRR